MALALISVVMIQVVGFRAQGFGYLSKFFNFRTMFKVPFFGAMDFLVGLLELISELSKILSFAFRLFGNMFAGIVLVAIVAGLLGKISILPSMIMMFELFVGLIQAFVFGMLTMVFMAQATQGHGHEEQQADAHAEGSRDLERPTSKEALDMEGNILDAARFVGAGLAMIGAAGAGVGIGLSVQGALTGMARNPDTYGNLLTNMILGIAFSEAIAIYCLVIAFLMLFKVV